MPFDFAAVHAPFRMQPGLRRIAPGTRQLTPLRPGDAMLAAKLAVLSTRPHEALLCEEGFDPSGVVAALIEHATAEHPHALRRAAGLLDAPSIGASVATDGTVRAADPALGSCLEALPAEWRNVGLLCLAFAEDFALLDAATTRVPWLAVCLPSSWSPEHKVGRSFAEIHAPVAEGTGVVQAAPALARLVCEPTPLERFVWTLTPEPSPDRHPARVHAAEWPSLVAPAELARRTFLRHERQTFIALPERRQAVFTIRVEVEPLTAAVTDPTAAGLLHAALATMSDAVLAYRGLTPARDRLLAWLADVAAGEAVAGPPPGGSAGTS